MSLTIEQQHFEFLLHDEHPVDSVVMSVTSCSRYSVGKLEQVHLQSLTHAVGRLDCGPHGLPCACPSRTAHGDFHLQFLSTSASWLKLVER